MFLRPSVEKQIFSRTLDDLIINIRDVHTIRNIVAEIFFQNSANDVERQIGARVTHMRGSIHCGSTDIPIDTSWCSLYERHEFIWIQCIFYSQTCMNITLFFSKAFRVSILLLPFVLLCFTVKYLFSFPTFSNALSNADWICHA